MKRAVLFGASGLVGSALLLLLLQDDSYTEIVSFGRRALDIEHPRLISRTISFSNLGEYQEWLPKSDVFCCLGTTIKTAGSREAFRLVDHTYPLEIARLSLAAGASQFLVITAMGADSSSSFFYNRVKGELEHDLKQLSLPALHIFRPSLLLGDRREHRLAESFAARLAPLLTPLLIGPFRTYRPVQAADVAKAMLYAARKDDGGQHVYPSDKIALLAAASKVEN